MLIIVAKFVVGLLLLLLGGELLVRGSSRLATALGVPPLLIGLTIVSMGTSSPELVVSVVASLQGTTDIALGNVFGSNIMNTLLVLGSASLLAPLSVHVDLVRRQIPLMIATSAATYAMALNGSFARWEGVVLLLGLVAFLSHILLNARRHPALSEPDPDPAIGKLSVRRTFIAFLQVGLGVCALAGGGDFLVRQAVVVAQVFEVSERVIGVTLVAAGTSLPELVTSVIAAARREVDIAVGNVVGSNLFNLMAILGAATTLRPASVPVATQQIDLPLMLLASIILLPVARTGGHISRLEGVFLVAGYLAYIVFLLALT